MRFLNSEDGSEMREEVRMVFNLYSRSERKINTWGCCDADLVHDRFVLAVGQNEFKVLRAEVGYADGLKLALVLERFEFFPRIEKGSFRRDKRFVIPKGQNVTQIQYSRERTIVDKKEIRDSAQALRSLRHTLTDVGYRDRILVCSTSLLRYCT